MFRQQSFPSVVMNPQDAHSAYIRGEVELVRIRDAEGRIAAEGALPYPPGVLCVNLTGEVWGGAVQRYFLALEEGGNLLPGFTPELQGVYSETDAVAERYTDMSKWIKRSCLATRFSCVISG